jgi:signal-transduction protein with cAMP-binding, CBS, and nucleotidyltransferase domain
MDRATIERIDAFAYRHRVLEVMTTPVVTIAPAATLEAATRLMREKRISALIAVDERGAPEGMLTERDVLAAVAREGAAALARPVAGLMSSPVIAVPPDAFLHVALARMEHYGFRHLAVTEAGSGRLLGILSARALLKQRAAAVLALGDDIAAAADVSDLAAAYGRLPQLARSLLAEGMWPGEIAQVISDALGDLTGRAAALAAAAMEAEGRGPAPAPWAFLILGSAGRGESLLAADQDNALVHGGGEDLDPWFAELGARSADILNTAGLVYCPGGVMAKNPGCRHSLAGWKSEIDHWIDERRLIDLLNADIFYDFRPVHGDLALAEDLRAYAMAAAKAPAFLMRLAHMLDASSPALSPVFGRFRVKAGRVDLKRGGLRSLVAAARILALRIGAPARSTAGRLAAATEAGLLPADDLALFRDAAERLLRHILEQQLVDIEAGRKPDSTVEIRRLPRIRRERLRAALLAVGRIDLVVRDALGR